MAVTAVAFLAGMAAAMGLGGGSFLIIYLRVFAGVSQQAAQGINLVFFIPAAACAVWLHTRNRLVDWKSALPAMIAGAATAIISANIAMKIDGDISRKLFGAFVLIMGMKMLSEKPKSWDIISYSIWQVIRYHMWYFIYILIYILIFRAEYIGIYACKICVYIYLHAFYISNICCKYQFTPTGKYSNVENSAYCTINQQLL